MRVIADGIDSVMKISEALSLADEQELDLVLVSDTANPPVCRLMNYEKFLYKKAKKTKNNKSPELKEIRMGNHIAKHDIATKVNNARRILLERDKVKIAMIFKGREVSNINTGIPIIESCVQQLLEVGTISTPVSVDRNQVFAILSPR